MPIEIPPGNYVDPNPNPVPNIEEESEPQLVLNPPETIVVPDDGEDFDVF